LLPYSCHLLLVRFSLGLLLYLATSMNVYLSTRRYFPEDRAPHRPGCENADSSSVSVYVYDKL
jgi:hypothetical protein